MTKKYLNEMPSECLATEIVDTSVGKLQGGVVNGVNTFLGVPYAKPPIDELRFLPPQTFVPHAAIRECRVFSKSAMQWDNGIAHLALPDSIVSAFKEVFVRNGQSEDCLYLNIWTSDLNSTGRKPVLVWFHLGAFDTASASFPITNGENLAREQDVVVVSVNHRLNAFGFLDLSEHGDERFALSGNLGMLDLVCALEWVRDNIAQFGGDPANVTVGGHSGGAFKVTTLLNMPAARGLFHKAIIQSGVPRRLLNPERSSEKAALLAEAFSIDNPRKLAPHLQQIPAQHLVEVIQDIISTEHGRALKSWQPVVDGVNVLRQPLDEANANLMADVPILIGCNKDEFSMYALGQPWWGEIGEEQVLELGRFQYDDNIEAAYALAREAQPDFSASQILGLLQGIYAFLDPTVTLADLASRVNSSAVYFYLFGRESPLENGALGAGHLMEAPYVFGTLDRAPLLLGADPANSILARQMSKAWASFMRSGNPNTEELPEWDQYDSHNRKGMYLDVESKVITDAYGDIRSLCREYKPKPPPEPDPELLARIRAVTGAAVQ